MSLKTHLPLQHRTVFVDVLFYFMETYIYTAIIFVSLAPRAFFFFFFADVSAIVEAADVTS